MVRTYKIQLEKREAKALLTSFLDSWKRLRSQKIDGVSSVYQIDTLKSIIDVLIRKLETASARNKDSKGKLTFGFSAAQVYVIEMVMWDGGAPVMHIVRGVKEQFFSIHRSPTQPVSSIIYYHE